LQFLELAADLPDNKNVMFSAFSYFYNLTFCKTSHHDHHHHNRFTALFPGPPGEPVPEENFWTLWFKGRLTEADTPIIRLGATPSRLTSAHLHHLPHFFYRPDALPAAQPTVSKH